MNTLPARAAAVTGALLLLAGCAGTAAAPPSATPAPSTSAGRLVRAPQVAGGVGATARLTVRTGTPTGAPGPVWAAVDPEPAARSLRIRWTDTATAPACGAVDAAWVEQAEQRIVVVLTRHAVEAGVRCSRLAGPRTATIPLSAPIGDRVLMERLDGTTAPTCRPGPLVDGSARPSALPSGAVVTGPRRMCPMTGAATG